MDEVKNEITLIKQVIDNEEERTNEMVDCLQSQIDHLETRVRLLENILGHIIRRFDVGEH